MKKKNKKRIKVGKMNKKLQFKTKRNIKNDNAGFSWLFGKL